MQLYLKRLAYYTHAVRAYGTLAWAYQSATATPSIDTNPRDTITTVNLHYNIYTNLNKSQPIHVTYYIM